MAVLTSILTTSIYFAEELILYLLNIFRII